jgi:MFS family permease
MSFLTGAGSARDLWSNRTICWLLCSRFFAALFFYSTTIVLFQQERGLNFTEMFLMESVLSAAIWCADIPTSVLADRFGYRGMMIIGRAFTLVGTLVMVFVHGFWWFALDNVFGGIGIACVSGCESALVYRGFSLEKQRRDALGSLAFTWLGMASSAGSFLGLFAGSFIGAYSPTLAVVMSLPPLLFSLLAACALEPAKHGVASHDGGEVAAKMLVIVTDALRVMYRQPVLMLLSTLRSLGFAFTNAIFWYNQPYFARVGIPVWLFGPLMALAMLLQMLGLLRLSALQRTFGLRLVLFCSYVLPGSAYILLALVTQAAETVLLMAGLIVFSAWTSPLVEGELNRRITSDESRATILSGLSLVGSLVAMLVNVFVGMVGDRGLVVTGLGLGGGLLLLAGCVPFLALFRD